MNPDDALAAGRVAHQTGELKSAEAIYREILGRYPRHAAASYYLGALLVQTDRPRDAIVYLDCAVNQLPDQAEVLHALAIACHESGDHLAARRRYDRVLQIDFNHADAHYNLGRLLRRQGDLTNALIHLETSHRLNPFAVKTLNELGNACCDREDFGRALQAYGDAIALNPSFGKAHYNRGRVLDSLSRYAEAMQAYEDAIAHEPKLVDAWFCLGASRERFRNNIGALDAYEQCIRLCPASSESLWAWLHQKQQLADWTDLEHTTQRALQLAEESQRLFREDYAAPFCVVAAAIPTTLRQQQSVARYIWRGISKRYRSEQAAWDFTKASAGENRFDGRAKATVAPRIRLGYIGGDFHDHAVSKSLVEVFESHDRNRFETFAYSYGPEDDSQIRRRIRSAFGNFRDVKDCTDKAIVQQIREDEIDILIDLAGHTQSARLGLWRYRPGKTRGHLLGYPGTLGSEFFDFMIADRFVVPMSLRSYYDEAIIDVDGCFLPSESNLWNSIANVQRSRYGLPEKTFVFCSFNAVFKITPEVYDCWMRILKNVPASVLWLKKSHSQAMQNLKLQAEAAGVDPQRIFFAAHCDYDEHLRRHQLADLFLDTFPYNGHSTAAEALRSSLPLLTLCGESFASRVAGSLLHHLGLDRLVAKSLIEYEAQAIALANNASLLAQVRCELETAIRISHVFDGKCYARRLEEALLRYVEERFMQKR